MALSSEVEYVRYRYRYVEVSEGEGGREGGSECVSERKRKKEGSTNHVNA